MPSADALTPLRIGYIAGFCFFAPATAAVSLGIIACAAEALARIALANLVVEVE